MPNIFYFMAFGHGLSGLSYIIQMMEVPSLLENGSVVVKQKILDKTQARKEVEVNDRGCCH